MIYKIMQSLLSSKVPATDLSLPEEDWMAATVRFSVVINHDPQHLDSITPLLMLTACFLHKM